MTRLILAGAMLFASVAARAETGFPFNNDPLALQILSAGLRENGSIKTVAFASVSGRAIKLDDPKISATPPAKLAPAANPTDLTLKTMALLAGHNPKTKRRQPARAKPQLEGVASGKGRNWGDRR